MATLFSTIQINGRTYTVQNVEVRADGGQDLMVSRSGSGTMFSVSVAADGSFGAVAFAY